MQQNPRSHSQLPAVEPPLLVLLALVSVLLTGCGQRLTGQTTAALPWSVGFWLWAGGATDATAAGGQPFDVLYVQVGHVASPFADLSVSWPWRSDLPAAAGYWAVWRYDPPARVAEGQIAVIARDFLKRKAEAAARGQTIAGIQLDYDCPTDDLVKYASYLEKLAKALPHGTRISITALLDWFRPHTRIRDVLAHTSEFVPQFYDLATPTEGQSAIAEPIDAGRWGPIFNSFGIPYRVGITSFGRIVYLRNGSAQAFRDVAPLDVLGRPGLKTLKSDRTAAGERRFVVRAEQQVVFNYWAMAAGDQAELILPTRDSVLAAYDAARRMGGLCAGVIFFRWPTVRESLVLNPAAVLNWVSGTDMSPGPPRVEIEDGDCAAVYCSDLQIVIADRLPEHAVVYRIQSSRPLEYLLPNPRIKSRIVMAGVSSIRLELPAFHGAGLLYLGRAVTEDPAKFTVTEAK